MAAAFVGAVVRTAATSTSGRRVLVGAVTLVVAVMVAAVAVPVMVGVAATQIIFSGQSQADPAAGGSGGGGFNTATDIAALCAPPPAAGVVAPPVVLTQIPAGLLPVACAAFVSTDARTIAQALVAVGGVSEVDGVGWDQIKGVAAGTPGGCRIDARILRLILAVRFFNQPVVVSDINRFCTDTILGAGTQSPHYLGGGGYAVDFAALDGHALTGRDEYSHKIIEVAVGVLRPGSRIGQDGCGPHVDTGPITQFNDTCTHLHVDVYLGHELKRNENR